jgi:class 3 adenylate cyclase/PAS domain-containing protein
MPLAGAAALQLVECPYSGAARRLTLALPLGKPEQLACRPEYMTPELDRRAVDASCSRPGEGQRHRTPMAALEAISRGIAIAPDLNQLCRLVQGELATVLESSAFYLGLYNAESESVEVVMQFEAGVELPGGVVPIGSGLMGQVIRKREPRLIRRWSVEGPRVQVQYATGVPGLPESAITVPLLVGNRVVGVLGVQSVEPNAFDEDDMALLEAVGGLVAAGIESLRHSSKLDVQLLQRISELEAILTNMAEGLLIVDDLGRVIRLNPAARHLLSVDENSSIIVGELLSDTELERGAASGDQAIRAVANALRTLVSALQHAESVRDLEVELGESRVLSFTSAPIQIAGRLAGGVIVFRDVTERHEIERLKDQMLREVEERSRGQLAEIERLARLRRFLSPQVAEAVASGGEESLRAQRREVCVVFCDIRGSTAFSESTEPEEAMAVFAAYHEALGAVVSQHGGTIEHRAGDGMMIIFNAPLPCTEPARRAVRMALAMRSRFDELAERWRRRGHELGLGIGISLGYATVGLVGAADRFDYTANGGTVVLAARLCDEAAAGQIVASQRVIGAIDEEMEIEPLGDLMLKGFPRPMRAYNIASMRDSS